MIRIAISCMSSVLWVVICMHQYGYGYWVLDYMMMHRKVASIIEQLHSLLIITLQFIRCFIDSYANGK